MLCTHSSSSCPLRHYALRKCFNIRSFAPRYNHTSSATGRPPPNDTAKRITFSKGQWTAFAICVSLGVAGLSLSLKPARQSPITPDEFRPWNIQHIDRLSAKAAVLTLTHDGTSTRSEEWWRKVWGMGIWAVQIKQPQLQILREYTPLSPIDPSDTSIRIYVREVQGGEISSYLLRQELGNKIEIRGPVYSWFYPGTDEKPPEKIHSILFIAGGTGIAPAMQMARHLLGANPGLYMKVLWANRQEAEKLPTDVQSCVTAFKGRLEVDSFYDSKKRFIELRDINAAFAQLNSLEAGDGKRLIVVSGPSGFVEVMAGKKIWRNGVEHQGPVRGLLGSILDNVPKNSVATQFEILKL